ncbi:hypothetical protein [Alicyclobacillus ferrooxydans]|uniref:Uncharacterized protein n=1 Tax=Alicyclobacillus ferrooxydans TaxID=471514 RepID=A0A0P9GNE3_9BACL|nr:hypothetical protein [Alicyclobacillus ferrooxydans]KPV41996.1 hypothetical protein AN477_19700 [Alicyclobacillus ferrooxydans]
MSIPSFEELLKKARAELDAMEASREQQKTATADTEDGLNSGKYPLVPFYQTRGDKSCQSR